MSRYSSICVHLLYQMRAPHICALNKFKSRVFNVYRMFAQVFSDDCAMCVYAAVATAASLACLSNHFAIIMYNRINNFRNIILNLSAGFGCVSHSLEATDAGFGMARVRIECDVIIGAAGFLNGRRGSLSMMSFGILENLDSNCYFELKYIRIHVVMWT